MGGARARACEALSCAEHERRAGSEDPRAVNVRHPMTAHDPFTADPAAARCYVTGASGFIGGRLCAALAADGRAVQPGDKASAAVSPRSMDANARERFDFTEASAWTEFLRGATARDTVVHLAGRLGVRAVVSDPGECWRQNTALTRALVATLGARSADSRPRVFAASTSEVYMPLPGPLTEHSPLRRTDGQGRWTYAAAKVASEALLDAALAQDGAPAPVHLRFFNVVGPGQDSAQGMMLPTFVEHALAGRPIPVHGNGTSVRTLAHVDDVARTLCALVALEDLPGGPLNVGGVARASVLEIAECVLALSGSRAGIVHVDPKVTVGPAFEDIDWREPDLARLRALGVPIPSRSLEAIVQDTLERHLELMPRRDACGSRAS